MKDSELLHLVSDRALDYVCFLAEDAETYGELESANDMYRGIRRVVKEFREFASESEKPQVDAWLKSIDEYFQESYSKGSANL